MDKIYSPFIYLFWPKPCHLLPLRYLNVSAPIQQIRGLPINKAILQMEASPKKHAKPILQACLHAHSIYIYIYICMSMHGLICVLAT